MSSCWPTTADEPVADMAVMSPEAGIDAGGEVAGGEDGAGRQALGRHDDGHLLADDWNSAPATAAHTSTRATPRPICQGRRWWVGGRDRSPPAGSRPSGGDAKAGRVGAVVMAMETPVPQLLTDSIWATLSEVDAWVVRLGNAPAEPSGPAQATVHVMVAVIGKAASLGLPSGEGWPAEVAGVGVRAGRRLGVGGEGGVVGGAGAVAGDASTRRRCSTSRTPGWPWPSRSCTRRRCRPARWWRGGARSTGRSTAIRRGSRNRCSPG